MLKKLSILVFISGVFMAGISAQKSILLEYKPLPNQSFVTTYDMLTVVEQEIMGIDQKIEMKMLMVTQTKVKEILSDRVKLTMSYQRLAIESLSPATNVSIDTDRDQGQPGIEYLKPMLGKEFEVTIDNNGGVQSVDGLERIIKDIIAEIDTNNPAVKAYENTLTDAFGVENIKNNLEYIIPHYPNYEVSAGDEWSFEKVSKTAQFEFKLENVSTLKEISSRNVIIQTASTIDSPGAANIEIEGLNARAQLKGEQVGEIRIDPETGVTKSGIIKQKISGNLWVDMSEQGGGNLKVPMKINSEIELNVIFD